MSKSDPININRRFPTREVKIGNVKIGGFNHIVPQSMVIAETLDTVKAVQDTVSLYDSGCDLIRFTTPSIKDSTNLSRIKAALLERGISVPLIADVHFTPNAAIEASKFADKVRINPGNFADRKKFESLNYTEAEYEKELLRVRKSLLPFIESCKKNNCAVRIGVNHGSLSDRVTSYYGDTPIGMVKSAVEFIEIFRELDFHEIVVSLKSSSPEMMIKANRLFCLEMIDKGWDYPLHLGVTEAGEGEDGRIKSALGIGVLMEDGIGDTIRVSLTEAPENEIPVAKKLIDRYANSQYRFERKNLIHPSTKRTAKQIADIGGHQVPVIVSSRAESKADYQENDLPEFIEINVGEDKSFDTLDIKSDSVLVLFSDKNLSYHTMREFFRKMEEKGLDHPVILKRDYKGLDKESISLFSSIDMGGLLIDGYGNGIWIESNVLSTEDLDNLSFRILQASRTRISKTEYISCPSCGRTQFDLQETTAKIRECTSHLKGLKIGIMGCIVNGPGEMADADYGYVGSGKNKIALYKKHKMIKSNIPSENAVNELIELIKENGDWQEP